MVDAGSGNTISPNAVAFGGHNLGDLAGSGFDGGVYRVQYSDNGSTYTNAFDNIEATDNLPKAKTFDSAGAHRYWDVVFQGFGSSVVQVGVVTLGRRLDISEGGIPGSGIEPYGIDLVEDTAISENGHFLGSNPRHESKVFRLNYTSPGLLVSEFFAPSSGIGWDADMRPHIKAGNPFWFHWNSDEQEADGVWLCKGAPGRPRSSSLRSAGG